MCYNNKRKTWNWIPLCVPKTSGLELVWNNSHPLWENEWAVCSACRYQNNHFQMLLHSSGIWLQTIKSNLSVGPPTITRIFLQTFSYTHTHICTGIVTSRPLVLQSSIQSSKGSGAAEPVEHVLVCCGGDWPLSFHRNFLPSLLNGILSEIV